MLCIRLAACICSSMHVSHHLTNNHTVSVTDEEAVGALPASWFAVKRELIDYPYVTGYRPLNERNKKRKAKVYTLEPHADIAKKKKKSQTEK